MRPLRAAAATAALLLLAACGPAHPSDTTPTPAPSPSATASPTPPAGSGVRGVVMLGPTCPVQRQGQPACERPVATTIAVATAAGAALTTASSDAQGHFSLALAPGTYVLTAQRAADGSGMHGVPLTVTVTASQWSEVTLTLDTGIR